MAFNITIVQVCDRVWIDPAGAGSSPAGPGATEYQQVLIDVGVGSGKRLPNTRIMLNVPVPYSQAGVIQALRDYIATLPAKHPDDGAVLGVS